ncbi:P-loop containing nucleoside triphosphate hydrolase protein, partial [Ochromonadaceae sp. CCMP2298]
MRGIYVTTPHYIRCLKPNDENVSDTFSRLRITEQLRYGGVLEAVRVARSGFPVRLAHLDFYARYRPLANPFSPALADLAQWRSKHAVDKQSVQLGLTKVFLRKTAHDVLESRRSRRIAAAARRIQRRARGMREQRACLRIQRQVRRSLHRRRFLLLRQAVLLLQSRARARAGRR